MDEKDRISPRVDMEGVMTIEERTEAIKNEEVFRLLQKYAIASETPPEFTDKVGLMTTGFATMLYQMPRELSHVALAIGDEVWYALVSAYHMGREAAGAKLGTPTYEYDKKGERVCGCRGCRNARYVRELAEMELLANAPGSEVPQ